MKHQPSDRIGMSLKRRDAKLVAKISDEPPNMDHCFDFLTPAYIKRMQKDCFRPFTGYIKWMKDLGAKKCPIIQ